MTFLCIEIGGSKLQIVTGTGDGRIVDCQRLTVDKALGGEGIRAQIKAAIQQGQPQFQWAGIGVGYGGPVDGTSGQICCSHHVAGWEEFPLGGWLRDLTGLPVGVDNDTNVAALGNDYAYDDVFLRQLENYGNKGDIVLTMSVSGNSPSCIKALEWAKKHGLVTVALLSAKRGLMADIADHALIINDTHYGRVEDAQMTICHILCYAFMENEYLAK